MTPFILQISKQYEDYSENKAIPDPENMTLSEFMKIYFTEGFKCLVIMGDSEDTCNFVLFYLIGYVSSLFVLQLSLTYVSCSVFVVQVDDCVVVVSCSSYL